MNRILIPIPSILNVLISEQIADRKFSVERNELNKEMMWGESPYGHIDLLEKYGKQKMPYGKLFSLESCTSRGYAYYQDHARLYLSYNEGLEQYQADCIVEESEV